MRSGCGARRPWFERLGLSGRVDVRDKRDVKLTAATAVSLEEPGTWALECLERRVPVQQRDEGRSVPWVFRL